MLRKPLLYTLILIVLIALFWAAYSYLKTADLYTPLTPLPEEHTVGYTTSAACAQCHPKEYAQWQMSDHFKAMQVATDSTVLGDFNNATYTADGITSLFFRKDGQFFIRTQNEKGEQQDFPVRYTFGHYPLQQYITDFPNGKKQVFRQCWDSREKRWFHQYGGEVIPPDDYLHWTQSGQNWNLMCASCHSTNLQKNLDPYTDSYHTTYSELTVGCEACHGAAKEHLQSQGRTPTPSPMGSQSQELNACMPCHSRRGEVTQHHQTGKEIMDDYLPELPTTPLYFADGQVKDENYKYTSFLQSKMYHHSVRCTSCHSPHTGKLKAEGSKVCMQCHSPKYATPAHTFHQGNAAETDCRVCHMPTRTYMGNDVRHDHNFAVPRPDLSARYATPNACNACHTQQPASWAAQAVERWYGKQRKPHFAETLIQAAQNNPQSLPAIKKLLQDAQTPDIVRAAAVYYLGNLHTDEALPLLKKELKAADPQTRYRAVVALADQQQAPPLELLLPLLTDPVKAVRMAAANALLTYYGVTDCQQFHGFEQAHQEYKTFVLSQADFPLGAATAGDYFVKVNDPQRAISFYERALKKDKTLNYLRLNLATLYNGQAQNNQAEKVLKEAIAYEPRNAEAYYFLALLYSEQKRYQEAKNAIERAMQLGMKGEKIQRNYKAICQFAHKTNAR